MKLIEVFTGLGMNPTLLHESMLTPKWIDIGFQGDDPTTDFRGTGSLGLYNLHNFVTHRQRSALQCLAHARDKQHEYFLACAGINVTHHMMRLFSEPEFCTHFASAVSEEEVLTVFNGLYAEYMTKLDAHWTQSPLAANFMNFNTVMVPSTEGLLQKKGLFGMIRRPWDAFIGFWLLASVQPG